MSKFSTRGTAALIVSLIALVAAIGGVAAAVPAPKGHAASTRGKRGPRGRRGPRGPQGPAGVFSASNVSDVDGPVAFMAPYGSGAEVAGSLVICPNGGVALGGGPAGEIGNAPLSATTAYDNPLNGGAWEVIMVNDDDSSSASFHTVATCASTGGAAHDFQANIQQARRQFAQDLASARAKR